jgi:hypothetical protein
MMGGTIGGCEERGRHIFSIDAVLFGKDELPAATPRTFVVVDRRRTTRFEP